MFPSANFASLVRRAAAARPGRVALCLPGAEEAVETDSVTYGELWRRVAHHAAALQARGVQPGDRVLVVVPLSVDLYAAVLAVMTVGAVAVLIPTGSGLRAFGRAVRTARPRGLIGTGRALRLRWLVPALWRVPIRYALPVLPDLSPADFEPVPVEPRASALLTFTSGTTGRPKGADRTHGTLSAQHRALDAAHPAPPDAVALTCFPVAALHHLCCGHTAVLPALDLRDVSKADPARLLAQIDAHGVRILTGPPPVLQALADHALARPLHMLPFQMPPLQMIGVGGAPVPRRLLVALREAFPDADVQVLYGSTEAEPVASISAYDVLAAGSDATLGYPAGHPTAAASVRLVRLHDGPIRLLPNQALADFDAADGAWGEVVVAGAHVVERYVDASEAEARHKICDEHGRTWHRMGDVACRDAAGRLWLGGRLGRLLPGEDGPVAPFPLEMCLDALPGIERTALHAYEGRTLAWIQGTPDANARRGAEALLAGAGLPDVRLVPGTRLPVDGRHRWKVDYAALDRMAVRLSTC